MAAMTPEEFEEMMQFAASNGDTEGSHSTMDHIMCELLAELGYGAGVGVFRSAKKWYA